MFNSPEARSGTGRKKLLAGVLSVALVISGLTVLGAERALPVASADTLAWGECPERVQTAGAQCATVPVPLDYSAPDGETIDLTVSRLPARDQSRRQGVLFGNPGGPGGDALTFFDDNEVFTWPDGLRDEWDLVAVQPRGLPDAGPLECAPLDPTDLVTFATNAGGAQRAACEAGSPGYSQHLTTENTARDWEEIRRAMGVEQVSIHGLSYGTMLGSTYATLFPERVDTMVLDSAMDPDWAWSEVLGQQDPAYIARFHDMLGWMASRSDEYGLGDTPLEVYQTWSAQVSAEAGVPPTVAPPPAGIGDVPPGLEVIAQQYIDGMTLTGPARAAVDGLVAQMLVPGAVQVASPTLNATRGMVPQSAMWPELAAALRDGEPVGGGADPTMPELPEDMVVAATMQSVILCNENQVPPRPLDYPEFLWNNFVTGDVFSMVGPMYTSGAACAGAPPVTSPLPVSGDALETAPLVVQTHGDPQTPWHGAMTLVDRMDAQLLAVGGGDHGAFAKGNPVVDDAVLDYLRSGHTDVTEAPAAPIPG